MADRLRPGGAPTDRLFEAWKEGRTEGTAGVGDGMSVRPRADRLGVQSEGFHRGSRDLRGYCKR